MNSYKVCMTIIGMAVATYTMSVVVAPDVTGFFFLYLLAIPYVFLYLGYWFFFERQLTLLRQALNSFISSKAAQTELTGQKDK